jgi:hypothetical protein
MTALLSREQTEQAIVPSHDIQLSTQHLEDVMGMIFQKHSSTEKMRQQLEAALGEQPPTTDEERIARADQLIAAATSEEGVAVNWRAFLVALTIFFVLLLIAFVVDWKNMVDDPEFYTGLAGTALGAVLGFLTGDAAATAVS